ncbi:hypothetical protein MMC31_001592 [Peltigera leucophlebia]|nr:hypothetical protein [Peltigera leucophlebia]
MSGFLYDDFVNGYLHNGEQAHRYCPGGLHPVHIDDLMDGDRYKIVHKLGYGASSTVWLARDTFLQIYVALKIREAGISKFHSELDILKHISNSKSDHPGRKYCAASLLLRQFWIDGPNGRHLALVFRVCGPSISRLYDWNIRLRTHLARSIALQVTQGLAYLHSEGICHGDLTAENLLFQINTKFDYWSEHKLYAQLGSPRMLNINEGHGRPRYLVDSAYFFKADPGLLTKKIIIVDHSESFFIKFPPLQELQFTNYYAAPELLFGGDANIYSDIWAIGCLIYEIRSGTPLFHLAIQNPPVEAVSQIIELLGKLPHCWDPLQFNHDGYLERYGCKNLVDLSYQIAKSPLDIIVKDIEAERISLPSVRIGLKGEKHSGKSQNNRLSSEIRAYIKDNTDIFWIPFPSARHAGIDETEQSHRQTEIEDLMSRKMTPLPKISAEESVSLTDLLSKILKYEPEQRISLEDLAQHPWLAAPAGGGSYGVSALPYTIGESRGSRSVGELGAKSINNSLTTKMDAQTEDMWAQSRPEMSEEVQSPMVRILWWGARAVDEPARPRMMS